MNRRPILRGVLGAAAIVLLAGGCAGNAEPKNATTDLGEAVHGNALSPTGTTEPAGSNGTGPAPDAAQTPVPAPAQATPSARPAPKAVPGTVVAQGQERNIVLEGQQVELSCDNGGSIDIEADGVVLTLTGHCHEIEVLGFGSTVKADSLDKIDVSGNGNTVSANSVAELTVEGNDNTITLGMVGDVDAEGSTNTVSFTSGAPEIEDGGSGNSISSR